MVWWLHDNQERRRKGLHFGLEVIGDKIYQTLNIMLNCYDENYDGYDVHSLMNVGVNIFNVDLTQHDIHFLEKIKIAMYKSQTMPELIPPSYHTPIALSVTMSADEVVDIDERNHHGQDVVNIKGSQANLASRIAVIATANLWAECYVEVDIIILKDIMTVDQLRTIKKGNKKFSSTPILFWPPTLTIEDLHELIKISDGVVVDPSLSNHFQDFHVLLRKCKDSYKPIFYMSPSIVEDYYKPTANDRQLLIQVHDIIEQKLDGIFLGGCEGKPPLELVQAVIRATEIIEQDLHVPFKDYFKLSFELPLPVLQPYSVALAASLAALQSGASAILVFTKTGASARILSHAAPPCPVLAITAHAASARRMHLYRKVMPLHYYGKRLSCWRNERIARIAFGTQFGLDTGLFNFGAKLVVLGSSEDCDMYSNSFQVLSVAQILHIFQCGKSEDSVF